MKNNTATQAATVASHKPAEKVVPFEQLSRGQKAARTRKANQAAKALEAAKATKGKGKGKGKAKAKAKPSLAYVNPTCQKFRDITMSIRAAIEAAGGKVNAWNKFSFSVKLPDWDAFLKANKGKDKAPFRKLRSMLTVEGFSEGKTVIVHRDGIIPFLKGDKTGKA